MVTEGGVGSGTSASSAYVPRAGRLRGCRVEPSCRTGETSVRLRLRDLVCRSVVGSCVGGEEGAGGGIGIGTASVAEGE